MPAVSTMRNVRLCQLQQRVDGVARGARDVADDQPLLAEQPVHERRLADVGPADDGHRNLVGRLQRHRAADLAGRLQLALDGVHQIVHAGAVLGRDLEHVIEAEREELVHPVARALVVGLVHRQQHRRLGHPANLGGNLVVARHAPFAAIDDEDDQIGLQDGALAVLDDQIVQRVLGVTEDAAGVDEPERHAQPLRVVRHHVAGGPGHRIDDGAAGPRDAVEQRRLAHVGAADEHHGGQRAGV